MQYPIMLRRVETAPSPESRDPEPDRPADYEERRTYRKLDQLLYRVLQLDEILHHRCAFNPEKAGRIKDRIEQTQEKLERVYTAIDDGKTRRSTMQLIKS
jgi:NH3-dependent NAD+ synthetase